MGIGKGFGYSVFANLFRLALCENNTECDEYTNKEWPVLRISPNTDQPVLPFPLPELKKRGTGTNENWLLPSYLNLVAQAKQYYAKISSLAFNGSLPPLFIDGRTCIRQHEDCLGDTRDALYMDGDEPLLHSKHSQRVLQDAYNNLIIKKKEVSITPKGPDFLLTSQTGDFLVVIGVIHTLTNKATYTNIAVYNIAAEMGVGAVIDDKLQGTANMLIPNDPNNKYFYVQIFARDNTCKDHGSNCFAVPVDFPGVPLNERLSFVERAYIEKETTVGPDGNELIAPTVLHYKVL